MSTQDRLYELIDRHLCDELSAETSVELAAILRRDPEARQVFASVSAMDGTLRRLAHPEQADLDLWPGVRHRLQAQEDSGRLPRSVLDSIDASRRRRPLRLWVGLAAALLFAVLGVLWWPYQVTRYGLSNSGGCTVRQIQVRTLPGVGLSL